MSSRIFRFLSLSLLSFVLLVVTSGLVLTFRGQSELAKSDVAFHDGRLRDSLVHARQAALAYVPGSEHVKGAYARLHAIAKGAESSGDRELAKIAWDTLRLVHVQTNYPGRPATELETEAQKGIWRLQNLKEAK
jgi:hypothetical protein